MKLTSKTLVAALTLGLTGLASAQDSATVDAVATLQQSTPPLAIGTEGTLSFGAVNIPNGTETGHTCEYNVGVSGTTPTYALYEFSELDQLVDASVPTPSGCDWGSTSTPDASYGMFGVTCNAASAVDFTATWTSGGTTGVTLEPGSGTVWRSFANSDFTSAITSGSSAGAMTSTCPANGTMYVAVGGRLVVGTDASAGSDVTIGTVTLEATY
ncbi:hypothetical protein [Ponticaulis sp.]|uniref:hypothetical protein n=1 Tax=Ponticaulis sp. TaxID=2020902 RepID=UPI000C36E194|nr:hypothetical protein [Ponticaulis sp.]MAF59081.1 hypothetical protein [Ponticaulis sp.]MBN03059.1 hypothetical protein [Ponticaulis sp.]